MLTRAYRHDLNGSELEPGQLQLEARDVTLRFGGVTALEEVSLEVRQGTVHAVIGPNGAGKTSLLNCVSGLYRPDRGSIRLHDADGATELTLDVNELAGVTVVLIEHDMDVVMDISDHVTALNFGRVIGDGSPDEVAAEPEVVEAYLGEGAAQ